jgi:hypothetical protein
MGQTGSGGHTSLVPNWHQGLSPQVQNGRSVKLTTRPQPAQRPTTFGLYSHSRINFQWHNASLVKHRENFASLCCVSHNLTYWESDLQPVAGMDVTNDEGTSHLRAWRVSTRYSWQLSCTVLLGTKEFIKFSYETKWLSQLIKSTLVTFKSLSYMTKH